MLTLANLKIKLNYREALAKFGIAVFAILTDLKDFISRDPARGKLWYWLFMNLTTLLWDLFFIILFC